jgi:flagellar biosynthesis/type III secretory pathway protein FliH
VGRVVKGVGHIVHKVTLDARAEAAILLDRARGEAAALIDAAKLEAESIRADTEAAREAGRRAGLEAGRSDAAAEAAAALIEARAEAARIIDGSGAAAIRIASKMAERIVGRAVSLSPEVMADIVGEALGACRPGPARVRVRVHPADLPAVEGQRVALLDRARVGALELVADGAVGRFGCVLETPYGRVDARLEAQLAALERALAGDHRHG